jgi:hydrogenase nickel incorporation protein HypB
MCATCGCGDDAGVRVTTLAEPSDQGRSEQPSGYDHAHPHGHDHPHPHPHDHDHDHGQGHDHGHGHRAGRRSAPTSATTETVVLEQDVLAKNDLRAARNRGWLEGRGITAYNVMSSPGSGKTTLLVRTIAELSGSGSPIAVVEGDQETVLDAERVRATGVPAVQINTGAGCHLDADMLHRGLEGLAPEPGTLLFIENVGNLVCPALFDLGETARVVVISVTEGDDKPLKYPHMFASADLVIVNKADLLPYVDFDVDACMRYARQLRPGLPYLLVSAKTGDGLDRWYDWLKTGSNGKRQG